MANAYSIQRNRRGWIDPTDLDFQMKAGAFKQEAISKKRAEIEGIIQQYKSLSLIRGVDKKYLNERLQYLVDNVNELGPTDLSVGSVDKAIKYHLSQALDENVMTAVSMTSKINTYLQNVAQLKEKHPELYNANNEAYGMRPAQEYMNSDKIGATIKGNLTYIPYKDYEGEIQKTLLDIQKNTKEGVYEYLDGKGMKQVIKVNGKSPAEIRQIAMGLIGNKYDQQIGIDAWAKAVGMTSSGEYANYVMQGYQEMIQSRQNEYNHISQELTKNLPQEKKDELMGLQKGLEYEIQNLKMSQQAAMKNPEAVGRDLEKMRLVNRMGSSIGALQTKSITYDVDKVFFEKESLNLNQQKLELDKKKFEWDQEMDVANLDLEREKMMYGAMSKGGNGNGSGANGLKPGESVEENMTLGHNSEDDEEYLESVGKQILDDYNQKRDSIIDNSIKMLESIDELASDNKNTVKNNLARRFKETELGKKLFAMRDAIARGEELTVDKKREYINTINEFSSLLNKGYYSDLKMLEVDGETRNIKDELAKTIEDASIVYKRRINTKAEAAKKGVFSSIGLGYGDFMANPIGDELLENYAIINSYNAKSSPTNRMGYSSAGMVPLPYESSKNEVKKDQFDKAVKRVNEIMTGYDIDTILSKEGLRKVYTNKAFSKIALERSPLKSHRKIVYTPRTEDQRYAMKRLLGLSDKNNEFAVDDNQAYSFRLDGDNVKVTYYAQKNDKSGVLKQVKQEVVVSSDTVERLFPPIIKGLTNEHKFTYDNIGNRKLSSGGITTINPHDVSNQNYLKNKMNIPEASIEMAKPGGVRRELNSFVSNIPDAVQLQYKDSSGNMKTISKEQLVAGLADDNKINNFSMGIRLEDAFYGNGMSDEVITIDNRFNSGKEPLLSLTRKQVYSLDEDKKLISEVPSALYGQVVMAKLGESLQVLESLKRLSPKMAEEYLKKHPIDLGDEISNLLNLQ